MGFPTSTATLKTPLKHKAVALPLKLDNQTKNHIERCLLGFSGHARKVLISEYLGLYQSKGERVANLFLLDIREGSSKSKGFDSPAHKRAFECAEIIRVGGYPAGVRFFEENGLTAPVGKLTVKKDPKRKCVIARMIDPDVWVRKLKKKNQQSNVIAIMHREDNAVCRGKEVYTPDFVVTDYIDSQKESAGYMGRQIAINTDGEELSLADIASSTDANPVNRRHLMNVRMRGIEDIAKIAEQIEGEAVDALVSGFICVFYTLTSPSKYHRKRWIKSQSRAVDNPKYQTTITIEQSDGSKKTVKNSPRLSLDQQAGVKARWRAKLKREGIETFGFSVVEPHHDGTPHQHLAVFMRPEHKEAVTAIFKHYALEEDGDEYGAQKHRLDVLDHDPKKGSVTGYMAKYISKGIAGFGIGEDFESGIDCDLSVIRILAWKSLWNFRQFSFFGSPSVSLWREFRKIEEPFPNETLEKTRLACDEGDWGLYMEIMEKHDIRLKKANIVHENGKDKKNKYGEPIERVVGIRITNISGSEIIRTRFKEWYLVDIDKLEKRIVRGLPFEARQDKTCLDEINNLLLKAREEQKIQILHKVAKGYIPPPSDYLLKEEGVYFNANDGARLLFGNTQKADIAPLGVL